MISHFPVGRFGTMKERFFFWLITKLVPHLLSVLLGTNSAYRMTLTIYIYIYIYNIYTHIYIYVNQFSSINTISTHIIYRNWRCFQWYVLILCWYMKTEKEAPNCAIWRSCSSLQVWRGLLGRLYNDMWHVFFLPFKKDSQDFPARVPFDQGSCDICIVSKWASGSRQTFRVYKFILYTYLLF